MTNEDIHSALTYYLSGLVKYCGRCEVHFSWPPPVGPILRLVANDGPMRLVFSVAIKEDGTCFEALVHEIGDRKLLDALPRGEVQGHYRIPERALMTPEDGFVFWYQTKPGVAENYSVYTEICARLQPKSIYEIGVRSGYSAYSMLAGVPTASYHGIDLDQGTYGGVPGFTAFAMKMLWTEFPHASVTIEYGDSQALTELPGHYDLIHVDGDHFHDGALHDLFLAARHADWVLIDDVSHLANVASAVTEFLERYPVPAVYYETWRGHVLMDTSGLS